jgi:cell division GTPase FtsZ
VATNGVAKLRECASVTIVLDNNRLLSVAADMPANEALRVVDRSVLRIVESVSSQTSS